MAKSKSKTLLRALGVKQEQPEQLRGLAAKGAGKATRYKPGDERLKKNQGQRKQIVPNRSLPKVKKKISELIKEIQHMPVAKEVAQMLGYPEDCTLAEAVVLSLFYQALQGDVAAVKHIQLNTENLRDGVPAFPVGPPPQMVIKFVKPDGTIADPLQRRTIDAPPAIEAQPQSKRIAAPFADRGEEDGSKQD